MEDKTKEHRNAPAEPRQESVPMYHRFAHTRLWTLLHSRPQNGNGHTDSRGEAMKDEQPTDAHTPEDLWAILDEFLMEIQHYCRKETRLAERMRTLRGTRRRLATALYMWTPTEAGEKCGHFRAYRTGSRRLRL